MCKGLVDFVLLWAHFKKTHEKNNIIIRVGPNFKKIKWLNFKLCNFDSKIRFFAKKNNLYILLARQYHRKCP